MTMKLPSSVAIDAPDPNMASFAAQQLDEVSRMTVTSREGSLYAQGFRAGISSKIKELDEQRKKLTRPLDQVKKQIMDLYGGPIGDLESVLVGVDRKILEYQRELDRLAHEQQRKLNEEAERKRLADQEIADRARAKGDEKKADKFEERAQTHVAAVVIAEPAKAAGVQFRELWKFEVIDKAALPELYKCADEKGIGTLVRSLGRDASLVLGKGVRIWSEKILASGRT